MRDAFYSSKSDEEVWNTARRLGKTFLLVLIAFEVSLRTKRARVAFGASQASDIEDIIEPMIDEILEDCPPDVLPRVRLAKHRIDFPNGSVIRIAGCDKGRYKYLRGRAAHLCIVDEAGFVDNLEHIVDSVLWPQTWTTGGRILLASTPPETIGHHFQQRYLQAKSIGASQRFTIHDNPLIDAEQKRNIITKAARKKGLSPEEYEKSTHWMREGLAEFVTDTERAVLPEYTEQRESLTLRPDAEIARPLWVDRYTVLDLGASRDWTAVIYSYWDSERGKLVVTKERRMIRPSTSDLAAAIKEDEAAVFPSNPLPGTETFRYMDGNEILIRDLSNDHQLLFAQTAKDDKANALMTVRTWIAEGRLEISDACKFLTASMRAAIWNKSHSEFERIEGFGHFDFVDALVYLVRNVLPNVNRLPKHYGKSNQTHFIRPETAQTQEEEALAAFLG